MKVTFPINVTCAVKVTRAWVLPGMMVAAACQPRPANDQGSEPQLSCEDGKQDLISTVEHLPERSMGASVGVALPESTLGGALGFGPVLEVEGDRLRLDGEPMPGQSLEERLRSAEARLASWSTEEAEGKPLTVYVAAASDLEVRELRRVLRVLPRDAGLRLLFRAPSIADLPDDSSAGNRTGQELAKKLLSERDPERREALATKGYRTFSKCDAIQEAVAGAQGLGPAERFTQLRADLLSALPGCPCDSLRAGDLKQLIVAE